MRILKAYALTTTTCANNKRTAQLIAKASRDHLENSRVGR
jgi:hypothetical protein